MRMCIPKVQRTHRSQRKRIVPPPTHRLGLWPRGCNFNRRMGAIAPPSHSWTDPLVEDMLCNARTGLTVAVVTGPGRAVLFYRRRSMGEGFTTDEARHATFLLTGAGMWVGKLAYLAADPMTIKRVKGPLFKPYRIVKLRWGDQDIPMWICRPKNPSSLIPQELPLWKTCLEIVVLTTYHHPAGLLGAGNVTGIGETKSLNHLGFLHLPQTVGLRVTKVCYQQLPLCCPGLTS